MAATSFRVGKVQIGANTMGYTDATLSITFATEDDSSMGQDWSTFQPLMRSWTLSGSAKFDRTNTAQALLISEFINGDGHLTSVFMYYAASAYFSGSVYCTSAGVAKSRGALDVLSWSMQGNGPLARA